MQSLFEMAGVEAPAEDPLASEITSALGADRGEDMFSGLNAEVGVGTEKASPEEQKMLSFVMDGIEDMIHGQSREDIVSALSATPELWLNIALVAQSVLEGAYSQFVGQGIEVEPDIFMGENGAVQTTVEMLYEIALASDAPNASDSNQLDMAYMKTVQLIGDDLFETDDVAASEAQQMMVDMEFGEGASAIAEEAFNETDFSGSEEDLAFADDMMAIPEEGEFL